MVERERSLKNIARYLTEFVTYVEASSALNFTDICHVAEDVFLPVFRKLLELDHLINLNTITPNYPAIDLGDLSKRVAIQVTSSSGLEKVRKTLQRYSHHNLFENYDELIIYIISKKQNSYSGKAILQEMKAFPSTFNFNEEKIWDFTDVLELISKADDLTVAEIESHLGSQLEGRKNVKYGIGFTSLEEAFPKFFKAEDMELNLVPIRFPNDINFAELTIDRQDTIDWARDEGWLIKNKASERKVAQAAMSRSGKPYRSDFTTNGGQIYTFQNLGDKTLGYSSIIDEGSIDHIERDHFEGDNDRQRILGYLIKTCFEKRLFMNGVNYDPDVGIYYFTPNEDSVERDRVIKWGIDKEAPRSVYKYIRKKGRKGDRVFITGKHFAFRMGVKFFDGEWYLLITPEWYITYNGEKRDLINGAEKIKYYKGQESNEQVRNHVRFIVWFINKHTLPSIEDTDLTRSVVGLLQPKTFTKCHPKLADDDWRVNDSQYGKSKTNPLF